ncbi:type II toxin-antitoxin system MqsR family toxin [Anaerotalea alkaliphila]|uniref:Uncharacterized protein n=1 Tax=Anaerotalea alkaliphila TaxID=2662126 RepID=A0A7X5KPA4_9FIRM|nr:type II toxin-antitoxin system MqsR family toxin [Anaerotalea alkaliphila]NDL67787.1 hypothetical protein [Anaerotalea alkaliphila]
MQSSQGDVEQVLSKLRQAIDTENFELWPRRKNMESFARLGIMPKDAIDEIYGLTYKEYVAGPEIDRDKPESEKLWIFKMMIMGHMFYIKFKIKNINSQLLVISCHIDYI